jgi:peroxiredoxin
MAYLEVVMPVQTEHRFPHDLSVLDAAGSRVTLADLRGQARAVAVYLMRTGTCPVCIQHARALARLNLPTHGVQPVVVPGSPTHAALPTGSFDGPTLQAAIDRP